GMVLLVILVGVGAFLAYENTLPTTVTANVKNGQKDVPTDGSFLLSFSRSVSIDAVKAAFSITPATDGIVTSVSGQTQYSWTPSKPLTELTSYTVSMKPIYDVGHHRVGAGQWSFTTIIIPRITAITAADGSPLKDGNEVEAGATMKLTFNDAMGRARSKPSSGTQTATLTWAADARSAT